MDGLSAASSVIAVLQIAQSIGSALRDYYEGVRDARDDIKKLYNSVSSLRAILSSIHHILNRENRPSPLDETLLTNPSGPLRQAELELHKLQLELKGLARGQKSLDKAVQSLIWPFKKKDIEKAVGTIERYKSCLTLELQVEHLHLEAEHFDISTDIRIEIRAARFDETRQRVISWLSRGVPDPSKEHNLARAKHEKTTGSWLIESPSFETWLKTENSLLWLNGGAGAGKSILSSTVVDYLQKDCKSKLNVAVVYWYFTFTDVEKQKVSHCLCSLIADICSNRRDTPTTLQEAYDQANYGQQKPTQESLITMLKAVLAGFEHVYMVIDGLDECPKGEGQRDELLTLIHEIYGPKLSCLHILLASRREIDIEDSFNKLPARLGCATEVSVHGAYVEQDIRNYLKQRLTHRNFEKWKPALKEKVETNLSTQVDGMFRLAALQLDALSQLRTESKIIAAIRELPKTLDAFYDRILSDIENEDDQKHARRALQWLAFAARPISLKELAEAVIVQVDDEPYLNEEDQFMDSKDILEILPAGLVSTNEVGSKYLFHEPGGFQSEAFYAQFKPKANSEMGRVDSDVVGETKTTGEQNSSNMNEDGDDVKQADGVENSSHTDKKSKEEIRTENRKESELMIQFAHFSVKEYLVSARVASGPQSKYYIDSRASELEITQICFAYLLYVGSQKPVIHNEIYSRFPLIHYAANCWPYHLEKLNLPATTEPLTKLSSAFLQYDCPAWQVWDAVGFNDVCSNRQELKRLALRRRQFFTQRSWIHPLTWISASGISCLMANLLAQKPELNDVPQTHHMGNPLYAAAVNGRLQVVEKLLAEGADVNYPAGAYGHSLQAACFVSQTAIVRLLLDAGAEVNAKGGHFGDALQAAAFSGSLEIVQILFQAGADLNAEGGPFSTALQAASYEGRDEVVKYLLEKGACINVTGGWLGSALQAASISNSVVVATLLLEHGADVTIQPPAGSQGSALRIAARYSFTNMVEVLLTSSGHETNREEWDLTREELVRVLDENYKKKHTHNSKELRLVREVLAILDVYAKDHGIEIEEEETEKEEGSNSL